MASFAEKKRDLLTPSNETASGGSAGNFKENCLSSYTPHGCFFLWLSSRRPHLCPDEFTCYQLKNKCAKFILFTAFWRWEGGGGGGRWMRSFEGTADFKNKNNIYIREVLCFSVRSRKITLKLLWDSGIASKVVIFYRNSHQSHLTPPNFPRVGGLKYDYTCLLLSRVNAQRIFKKGGVKGTRKKIK